MKSRNVFVSHVQEDEAHIEKMYALLSASGYECRDSSITSSTPNRANDENYIKYEILSPQIKWAGVVVVIVSPLTKDSKWVEWEVQHAVSLGKRVVGVWVSGGAGCELPKILEKYADSVVGWNSESIAAAIAGEDGWHCEDGSPMSEVDIKRIRCQ